MDGEEFTGAINQYDVWEVLYNPFDIITDYYINPITADRVIEGMVVESSSSSTSWNPSGDSGSGGNSGGPTYIINGQSYKLAYEAYDVEYIMIGITGTFYIDSYGKIAAFLNYDSHYDNVVWYINKGLKRISVWVNIKNHLPRVLVVVIYGDNNKIKDIIVETNGYSGYAYNQLWFYTNFSEGDYIKAYLWEDLNSVKPVAPMKDSRYDM